MKNKTYCKDCKHFEISALVLTSTDDISYLCKSLIAREHTVNFMGDRADYCPDAECINKNCDCPYFEPGSLRYVRGNFTDGYIVKKYPLPGNDLESVLR